MRYIALTIISLLVFASSSLLLFSVHSEREVEIDEEALDRARKKFDNRRRHRARSAMPRVRPGNSRVVKRPLPSSTRRTAARAQTDPKAKARASARASEPAVRPRSNLSRRSRPSPPRPVRAPVLRTEERQGKLSSNEVRTAYDRGDFLSAFDLAQDFLRDVDGNHAYVRRVATTSACAIGEETAARGYFSQMNAQDQRIIRLRCGRFGVEL